MLSDIYWIGGSPCAGKSSIADILSKMYGLAVYHVDQVFYDKHLSQITPQEKPVLYKWHNTPWNELWMQPHEVLLDEARASYNEHFDLIIRDLEDIEHPKPVIVEGTALLPDLVSALIQDNSTAIWLVPDEAFQRQHYPLRGDWVQGILSHCESPERALENWMNRDAAFGAWIIERTRLLQLEHLTVDGKRSIEENAHIIDQYFGFEEKNQFE